MDETECGRVCFSLSESVVSERHTVGESTLWESSLPHTENSGRECVSRPDTVGEIECGRERECDGERHTQWERESVSPPPHMCVVRVCVSTDSLRESVCLSHRVW